MRNGGMTLVEVVLFIVVVSVGLAGVLGVFNITTARSGDPVVRKQALALAEQMMEEVLLKDYANPAGGCTTATTPSCRVNTPADRPNYDDVSDYNGWNQSSVTDLTGTRLDYSVAVSVADSTELGVASRKITVTVAGRGETVTLSGHRTQYE